MPHQATPPLSIALVMGAQLGVLLENTASLRHFKVLGAAVHVLHGSPVLHVNRQATGTCRPIVHRDTPIAHCCVVPLSLHHPEYHPVTVFSFFSVP